MRSSWSRWLTRLGVSVSFGLIGWFLWRHLEDLRAVNWPTMAGPMAFDLVLYGLALGIQGAVWIGLFTRLTATAWVWGDVKTYFTTHLLRRLPGVPWYIVGRVTTYRERNLEAARAALAVSLLEWIGIILSGLVWVAWGRWGWRGLIGMIGALLFLVPWMRRGRWPARWVLLDRFSSFNLYTALLAYTAQWCLAAWMLYLLLGTLVPGRTPALVETGSLWAISGLVSSLAVFAPAGLGIRELSLVALLEPRVGMGYAALAALLMRVIFMVGDMVWGTLVVLLISRVNTP